ncbi:MAG: DUF3298 domain-containing protein [Smithella sp.]|jgi:uncharacterized protein YecT (DUF1311 family)
MVIQKRWRKLFFIIFLLGFISTQANAASFDCKKAASWLEKTVCANTELSKLDEQMAKAYSDALNGLSPEGQEETKQYQKQWLNDRVPSCEAQVKYTFESNETSKCLNKCDEHYKEIQSKENDTNTIDQDKCYKKCWDARDNGYYRSQEIDLNDKQSAEVMYECLKGLYKNRKKQLLEILSEFHGRIFRKVYLSDCKAIYLGENYEREESEGTELTYMQIENPHDENEKLWNRVILKKSFDDCKMADDTVEYIVNFSNKHLISLQILSYAHGGSHGMRGFESFSWLLDTKRKLKASDIFDNKTNWRKKLTDLVFEDLKEDEKNFDELKIKRSSIMDIVSSPDNWVVFEGGLGIQFGECLSGLGPYAAGAPYITIDWKTLDPYLSKNGHSLISD